MGAKAMAGVAVAIVAAALAVQITSAIASVVTEAAAFGGMALLFTGLLRRKDRRIAELRDENAALLRDNIELSRLLAGDDRPRLRATR